MQQVQWLSVMPILVLALVQSTWTMLAALAVRLDSLTVPEVLLSTVDMATMRMLGYDVKVCRSLLFVAFVWSFLFTVSTYSNCQWQLYLWRCSSSGRL